MSFLGGLLKKAGSVAGFVPGIGMPLGMALEAGGTLADGGSAGDALKAGATSLVASKLGGALKIGAPAGAGANAGSAGVMGSGGGLIGTERGAASLAGNAGAAAGGAAADAAGVAAGGTGGAGVMAPGGGIMNTARAGEQGAGVSATGPAAQLQHSGVGGTLRRAGQWMKQHPDLLLAGANAITGAIDSRRADSRLKALDSENEANYEKGLGILKQGNEPVDASGRLYGRIRRSGYGLGSPPPVNY